jgi:hypothetical protein
MSAKGFANALAVLNTSAPPASNSKLLPPEVCQRFIAEFDYSARPLRDDPNILRAQRFAELLMRGFPELAPHDPKGYFIALIEVLSNYSERVCIEVVDVYTGLPGRLGHNPKASDVREACETIKARFDVVRLRAQQHIAEYNRRQREAEEAKKYPRTPEERAAMAERLKGLANSLKSMGT